MKETAESTQQKQYHKEDTKSLSGSHAQAALLE